MKTGIMILRIVTVVTVSFSSLLASAAERTVNCKAQHGNQGTAQITVLPVEGHPELAVLKMNLDTSVLDVMHPQAGQRVHLSGLMVAQIIRDGSYILAQGDLHAELDRGAFIETQAVHLQGGIDKDGSMFLSLMDSDRVIQLGYGLFLKCN